MGRVRALAPRQGNNQGTQAPAAPEPFVDTASVARTRAIAEMLGARSFGLYAVLSTASGWRFLPLAVAEPATDTESRRFLGAMLKGELDAAAMAAATPAIWLANEGEPETPMSRWTRRIDTPVGGTTGVVFPIEAERSGRGLGVFLAPAILTEPVLCAAHMECFALYEELTRARRSELPGTPKLSKRELECLKLTADGLTSEEIAARLGLSVHTANQYVSNTTQKLNAVNRIHAVAKALRAGLFD